MSIFREHKSIVDRAASDRARHKKKIDKAIKESIKDVVAEESIIGQNGKKKIRIPIKGIKEYRFIFGANEKNKIRWHKFGWFNWLRSSAFYSRQKISYSIFIWRDFRNTLE